MRHRHTHGLFTATVFLLLLAGCSKNDPIPTIRGTWKQKDVVVTGCTNASLNGTTTCTTSCVSLIIDSNTVSTNGGAPAYYSISGDTITLTVGSTTTQSTYTVTSTTLTISTQSSPANGGCLNVTTFTRLA